MIISSNITYFPKKFQNHKNIFYKNTLFYCLLLLNNTEVRGFRILFQKPVNGQRTNSNAHTSKITTHMLYSYKYNVFKNLVPFSLTKPLFLAEYINLFWQQQWVYEWVSSYRSLKNIPIYVKKTNFIDIPNINLYNIYHFYNNPFKVGKKKNSQKRKKVVPKNKYSVGFPFGFSIIYSKQLQSIN